MAALKKSWLNNFLVWRAKHISQRQFIYILSILVGFTSGIGAVVLKNLTHFFQHLLEGNLVRYYHNAFYFVFPIIGLTIVYLIIKYVIRNKVSHGIPSTLFAISKMKGIMRKYQMFGSILTAPIVHRQTRRSYTALNLVSPVRIVAGGNLELLRSQGSGIWWRRQTAPVLRKFPPVCRSRPGALELVILASPHHKLTPLKPHLDRAIPQHVGRRFGVGTDQFTKVILKVPSGDL